MQFSDECGPQASHPPFSEKDSKIQEAQDRKIIKSLKSPFH